MTRQSKVCLRWLAGLVWTAQIACGAKSAPPAPPPLRPEPQEVTQTLRTDCDPLDVAHELAPIPYTERSIEEAQNLADQGFRKLRAADSGDAPAGDREQLLAAAVERFITALLADPYNVHATYNLAAAYARVGRGQCAVNLLERLAKLRSLSSLADEVEAKLDRLFGRKKYRGRLDPDFLSLRDDERFRDVAKRLQ